MKVIIETYSQYFTISTINFSKLIFMLHDFNKNLVTYTMVLKKLGHGRRSEVVNEIDKTLYIVENNNNLIRYPISLLEDIINNIKVIDANIEIDIKKHKHHSSKSISINRDVVRVPRPYQKDTIDKIVKWKKNNTLVSLGTGLGKFLDLNASIKIPNGWCRMGDIQLNDVVIGRDGKPTKVTGVYPQGVKQLFKVIFEDGRSVKAGLEHLWTVSYINYNNDAKNKLDRKVINTENIIKCLKNNINNKTEVIRKSYYVDLIEPEDFGKNDLNIEPYTFGKSLTKNNNILHIPNEYLTSSIQDRYDLLCGILNKTKKEINMYYMFKHICNETLSKDIQLLVRGLGGKCTITNINNKYNLKIDIRRNEEIDNYLKIIDIVEVEPEEAQCIAVDNEDKLYVTNDYIVTHNTLIASYALSDIKRRFMVLVLPRFIDKWVGDLVELTNILKEEIFVIQGIKGITDVILHPEKYDEYKCFILSITSINLFMKVYLNEKLDQSLKLTPEDITKNLKIDIVLNDESHMEFFNVYKFMLFSNHRLTIGLTATLVNRDKHINHMYQLGFPKENRIENIVTVEKYIYVYSIRYKFNSPKRIRFENHFGYNQSIFEKSLLKNSDILQNYIKMLEAIGKKIYFNRRAGNDKLVIFIGTVRLCKIVSNYFSEVHKDLTVGTYTEEDDLEVINNYDIIVTTVGSLGTAIDVKDLISVIQTVNVNSLQTNIQTLGRLRKRDDKPVIFAYTWTADINAHRRYNKNRIETFREISKSVTMKDYNHYV